MALITSQDAVAALQAAVPRALARQAAVIGGAAVTVEVDGLLEVLTFLNEDPAWTMDFLVDLTVVDHEADQGKLELIYVLRCLAAGRRLTIKSSVPCEAASAPSVSGLWKAALWLEREAYDMFGVQFDNHPDLRRILMYEEFEGHPLRKSYAYDKRQPLVPERDPIGDPWPDRYTGKEGGE